MKVLVCGGRGYADSERVEQELDSLHSGQRITCIVSGAASGADKLAEQWAIKRNVSVARYPADWSAFGGAAGPIRNRAMLQTEKPNLVLAFPGGIGTAHMVKIAAKAGVPILVINV